MTSRPIRRISGAAAGITAFVLAGVLTSSIWAAGDYRPRQAARLAVAARPGVPMAPSVVSRGAAPRAAAGQGPLPGGLAALQARVRRVPADWPAWSAIGVLQLERGRATGEPTAYVAAQEAFDRSLRLHPAGNDAALAGQAALATSRHQFADAERLARRALTINPASPPALTALTDALTELGRYPEALAAADRLDALRPGVASFTRLSHQAELRGHVGEALDLLARAAQQADGAPQIAFARSTEGLLLLSTGDVAGAARAWKQGMAAAPADPVVGLLGARLAWAQGDHALAARRYADLVARRPTAAAAAAQAEVLATLGRTREAASALAAARAGQVLARRAGIAGDSGDVLFEADHGDPAKAVALGAELWRRSPSVAAADAYGWALHVAGRHREALGYARRAFGMGGRPALLLAHRGLILAALGDRVAAVADLRAALGTDPSLAPLLASEARAQLAMAGSP
jgi:tetratricopeptide (TPR) repeat protein